MSVPMLNCSDLYDVTGFHDSRIPDVAGVNAHAIDILDIL